MANIITIANYKDQMKKRKFFFYLFRFRNSSLPELVYRAKQFFFIKKLKVQLSIKRKPAVSPRIDFKNIRDLRLPTLCGEGSKRIVQKILKGELFTLNTDLTAIRKIEDTWRNTFFNDIKISEQDPDIRSVWEPARLQHIAILINYIIQNEGMEVIDDVKLFTKNAILKWLHENPFLHGPHYLSAMECGLRIPLLLYSLKVLDNLAAGEFQFILDNLYRHAWWVSRRLPRSTGLRPRRDHSRLGLL